jgi:hypothetical protein
MSRNLFEVGKEKMPFVGKGLHGIKPYTGPVAEG